MRSILLVEDNEDIRAITEIALRHESRFDVVATECGEEALQVAMHRHFDVIILDVMMPGMDGPETLAAIRQLPSAKDSPVIFLTAKAQPREIQRLLDLGANGVITKPFDPLGLGAKVEEMLGVSR
ncbi:MAG: response regulator [Actinobacteria bacterium]|nr:response regulator [Actinomycetota bacterium]